MSRFVSLNMFQLLLLLLYIHHFDDLWCSWICDLWYLCLNCLICSLSLCFPFRSMPMRYHEIAWRGLRNGHLERCMVLAMKQVYYSAVFGHIHLDSCRLRWNFDVSEVKPWFRKSPSMCRKWNSPKWQNCHVEMLSDCSDMFLVVLCLEFRDVYQRKFGCQSSELRSFKITTIK